MKINVDLQKVSEKKQERPHKSQFKRWAELLCAYLSERHADRVQGLDSCTVCVRLVEPEESLKLNSRFKHENKAATVLAFPTVLPATDDESQQQERLLGDLVMCEVKILEQAKEWRVAHKDHWAHLYLHGLLHLFGFDHGEEMEQIEIDLLDQLGIANPY